jgi:hypothetical protein
LKGFIDLLFNHNVLHIGLTLLSNKLLKGRGKKISMVVLSKHQQRQTIIISYVYIYKDHLCDYHLVNGRACHAMSITMSNNHTYIGVDYLTCSLSIVWFVHSISSLEFSAGIGVLSMAKQEMLGFLREVAKGTTNSGFRTKM